ncbi:MAG: carbohydrate ABC transporter permease [Planctomycetota bacterium]|nr:carbohydrate ABC transporter permease [Planctomycetota bacterium]
MSEGYARSMQGGLGGRAGWLAVVGLLLLGAGITLLPFVWLICAAFKKNEDFFVSMFLPPGDGFLGVGWDRLTFEHMVNLTTKLGLARAALNSIFLSSVTAVVATLLCAMAGYALARLRFKGSGLVSAFVVAMVAIPWPLLLAPGYRVLYQMGLLDTFTGLILPAVAPAFGVFLFRQATRSSVPTAMIEAARVDGCGEIMIFFRIALPMVRPMIGAFMLVTFLGMWNNFIGPQVVLQSPDKFPLAVAVAQLRGVYYQEYGLLMAGTLLAIVPVLGLFLMLQREFISGLTSGAVKG